MNSINQNSIEAALINEMMAFKDVSHIIDGSVNKLFDDVMMQRGTTHFDEWLKDATTLETKDVIEAMRIILTLRVRRKVLDCSRNRSLESNKSKIKYASATYKIF